MGKMAGPTPSRLVPGRRGQGKVRHCITMSLARCQVQLEEARAQDFDSTNRQPLGAVLRVRIEGHSCDFEAVGRRLEDPDVDRQRREVADDFDDCPGPKLGRYLLQRSSPVGFAQTTTGPALGKLDIEAHRQQLAVEAKQHFTQIGRSARRPHDGDSRRPHGCRRKQQDRKHQDTQEGIQGSRGHDVRLAPIRHNSRWENDEGSPRR